MEIEKEDSSQNDCTPKVLFAIIFFLLLITASIIFIILVAIYKGNYFNSYYLSDVIEEIEQGTNRTLRYRKVDVYKEHYICELNDDVKRAHVRYYNRYGIKLAADLYTPKKLDKNKKYKGIVIGPPYGGVKEQGPSVYGNGLASRGYVVLAFDPSFNGESGGSPRKVSSSDIFMEDFSAGVDYLGTLKYVDREKIGAIGICGSGGFLIGAAAIDIRIKAVVTISLYDIPHLTADINIENWIESVKQLKKERWNDVDNGRPEYPIYYEPDREYEDGHYPSTPNEEYDKIWRVFYSTKRGHHPRSTGGFTYTSLFSIQNLLVTENIEKISPRPISFIYGEKAENSKQFSIETYHNAEEPKDLVIIKNATHIDLYDNVEFIPFDYLDEFFEDNLNKDFYN